MPRYEITSPDGGRYEVTAPEGATDEDVLSFAQSQWKAPQSTDKEKSWSEALAGSDAEAGIARTALDQSLQGATFGFADEITDRIGAGIASLVTGTPYSENLDAGREMSQERMQRQMEQRPALSIGSQLAGGILTSGAASTTAPGKALTSSLGRGGLGLRAAKGAGAGAASGALYGAGTGTEGNRLESAAEGAGLGAAFGAAAPIVFSAARSVIGGGAEKVAESLTRKIAANTGELPASNLTKAEQKVYNRLIADFGGDTKALSKALSSYQSTPNKSLIETVAGERTKNIAESASVYPTAASKSVEFFQGKVGAAPQGLKSSVSKTISPNVNYLDSLDEIVEKGREAASPLYKGAYQKNQTMASPLISKILATPEGKSGLSEAAKDLANEMSRVAVPDPELTVLAREMERVGKVSGDTTGGVAGGLKLKTMDYIKRGMDKTINRAYRAGDEAEAGRIVALKNALIKEMDALDSSGLYKKARSVSGDYITNKKAMEAGANFLNDDPEIVQRLFNEFGATEKRSYKVGVMKSIRDRIDKSTDGRNVATFIQNETMRNKLKAILPEKDYTRLLSDAKYTDEIYKLRNQVIGNSRTALRQIGAQEFDDAGKELISDIAKKGIKNTAIDRTLEYVQKQFDGLSDRTAGEVVDILYETDPKKKFQIVKKLSQEALRGGTALRGTEAAKKLEAFYAIDDAVRSAKGSTAPVIGGGIGTTQLQERPQPAQPQPAPEQPQSSLTPSDDFTAKNEGLRLAAYKDTTGNRTVGYGFNMQSGIAPKVWKQAGIKTPFAAVYRGEKEITEQEANQLKQASMQIATGDAIRLFPKIKDMNASQQMALIDLSYQYGMPRLQKHKGFINAVNKGDMRRAVLFLDRMPSARTTPERNERVKALLANG